MRNGQDVREGRLYGCTGCPLRICEKFEIKDIGFHGIWQALRLALAPTTPRRIGWTNQEAQIAAPYQSDMVAPQYGLLAEKLDRSIWGECGVNDQQAGDAAGGLRPLVYSFWQVLGILIRADYNKANGIPAGGWNGQEPSPARCDLQETAYEGGEHGMKKKLPVLMLVLVFCAGLMVPASAAGRTFNDVPATHWAHDAVDYVVDLGLFNGTGATTFSPDATMTRAMLTEVLYRYAGSPSVSGTIASETPFRDISDGAYYADAVVWAYQNDLFPTWFVQDADYLAAVPQTRTGFSPSQVMLRCEFAVMLCNFSRSVMNDGFDMDNAYFQYVGNRELFKDMGPVDIEGVLETTYDFTAGDNSRLGVANTMICWAYAQGIMTGTSADTMSPGGAMTRAQAAAMLMRYHRLYGSTPAPDTDQEPEDYELELYCSKTSLEVGETGALHVSNSAGIYVTYECSSSNPSVIRVEEPENILGGDKWIITALSAGTSVITVTDNNGRSVSAAITVTGSSSGQTEDPADEGDFISEVIRLVNEERAKEGLSALRTNDAIHAAAQVRADELSTLFDHTRPDGTACFTALDDAGIQYRTAGENIAAGYASPEQVVAGWMNSAGHRANILNADFTAIGVGCDSTGGYWVQLFIG